MATVRSVVGFGIALIWTPAVPEVILAVAVVTFGSRI